MMSAYSKIRRQPRTASPILAALALSWAFSACATTTKPAPNPQIAALERGQKIVLNGVKDGFYRAENVSEFIVDARRNPCDCDAPDDEIRVHGRWTRVYLKGDQPLLEAFSSQMSAAAERHEFGKSSLLGAFSGTQTSARGIEYPVFRVKALLK